MQADNMQRAHRGEAMAHTADAFDAVINEEDIGYNTIIVDLYHQ
jgi:hypothetical protein